MLRYASEKMMMGARVVAKTCLNVKAGEKVLIVTDTSRDMSVAQALFEAVLELGAEPVIAVMTPRKHTGDEPPYSVFAAMKSSDAIICPTTASMYHTDARIEACKAGARLLSMTGATPETLAGDFMFIDFEAQRPKVEKLAKMFMNAEEILLKTPKGTNIRAKIKGRIAHAETALCHEPGCCMGAPDIEANITPIEDSAEGILVVDGSISAIPGVVKEPIQIKKDVL
jgi:leucyl aminopeptidase (aminopeptidase T)